MNKEGILELCKVAKVSLNGSKKEVLIRLMRFIFPNADDDDLMNAGCFSVNSEDRDEEYVEEDASGESYDTAAGSRKKSELQPVQRKRSAPDYYMSNTRTNETKKKRKVSSSRGLHVKKVARKRTFRSSDGHPEVIQGGLDAFLSSFGSGGKKRNNK